MDFIDPNKKRAHEIRLYIGYTLMSILVVLGVIVLLYASFGYGIDRRGNVVQTGIVFTDSSPTEARVSYASEDGSETDSFNTPRRLSLKEGIYNFTFSRDGYRDWIKKIDLGRGDIERLVYAFLFPNELAPGEVVNLGKELPSVISSSPDRSRLMIYKDQVFDIYDTSKENIKASSNTFSFSDGSIFSGDTVEKIKVIEWSSDNRHVLVKHTFDKKDEYLVIDVEDDSKTVNLNRTVKSFPSISKITLFDKQPNELYVLTTKNDLLQIRISDGRSTKIESNVIDFKPYSNDRIIFVKNSTINKLKADVFVLDNKNGYFIRELDQADKYIIDTASFDGSSYIIASAVGQDNIFVYKDSIDSLSSGDVSQALNIRTLRVGNVQDASFSANAQFIQGQSGQDFVVYDTLDDRQHRFSIDQPFDEFAKPATWMDGHRLVSATANTAVVFDFDGNNLQTLTTVASGTTIYFDKDFKSYLSLENNEGKFNLMRTSLIVKN